jgi:hypothetical protein
MEGLQQMIRALQKDVKEVKDENIALKAALANKEDKGNDETQSNNTVADKERCNSDS